MPRYTTFRYRLDPTIEQHHALLRHSGAARFAFNQSLSMVKARLEQRRADLGGKVPWSKFDLINQFNSWKKTANAGRAFEVDAAGEINARVTGLVWRNSVCQKVFEEGAVDCARALNAWSDSRSGNRGGREVKFPGFKKKSRTVPSFRCGTNSPAHEDRSSEWETAGPGR